MVEKETTVGSHRDYPLHECVRVAGSLIESGATVHQKFTCRHCGSRQTMEEPNKFYTSGRCEECSEVTDIRISGCNYLLVY